MVTKRWLGLASTLLAAVALTGCTGPEKRPTNQKPVYPSQGTMQNNTQWPPNPASQQFGARTNTPGGVNPVSYNSIGQPPAPFPQGTDPYTRYSTPNLPPAGYQGNPNLYGQPGTFNPNAPPPLPPPAPNQYQPPLQNQRY